jgi:hypothetical protein
MTKLVIIFILFPTILWAQSATFYADTMQVWQYAGRRSDTKLIDHIYEMEWRINGQVLRFGSKPVSVPADADKIDTLFYKQHSKAEWDTIIFNVKKPLSYKFVYNVCCDGFNIQGDGVDPFISGQADFRVTGKQKDKIFVGTLGEVARIIKPGKNLLSPQCRSAMSPNIYWLSLQEIKICTDTVCQNELCLFQEGQEEETHEEIKFNTVSKKAEFLYMPLNSEPIQILYDATSKKVTIR